MKQWNYFGTGINYEHKGVRMSEIIDMSEKTSCNGCKYLFFSGECRNKEYIKNALEVVTKGFCKYKKIKTNED